MEQPIKQGSSGQVIQPDLFAAEQPTIEVPKAFKDPQEGLRGNIGEWSEVYTFLYLLAKGSLEEKFEDHQHNTVSRRLAVVNVIRMHPKPTLYFIASKNDPRFKNEDIYVREDNGDGGFKPTSAMILSRDEVRVAFESLHSLLVDKMQNKNGGKSAFGLPKSHPAMVLIEKMGWKSLKAPSEVKADLVVTTATSLDRMSTTTQTYSIKSSLGASATLFNANKTSNLDYNIVPIDPNVTPPFDAQKAEQVNHIQKGEKIKDRMALLKSMGYKLEYAQPQSLIFSDNLRVASNGQEIDKIVQVMLSKYFYADGPDKRVTAVQDFLPILVEEDPLKLKEKINNHDKISNIYRQSVKNLLVSMALGMTATKEFHAEKVRDQVSGGMLVVKQNEKGQPSVEMHSVLHLQQLEEYLFEKTMLETASTTRHQFAAPYWNKEANAWRMALNLQIRFIKEKAPKPVKNKPPQQMRMF
jgi:hypothetical protein